MSSRSDVRSETAGRGLGMSGVWMKGIDLGLVEEQKRVNDILNARLDMRNLRRRRSMWRRLLDGLRTWVYRGVWFRR